MRITSYINNVKCQEWGLNLAQGALFDLLNQVQSWAEPVYLDGEVFYWVSRQMIIREIPVAYSKPDTVYRALKFLAEKELIDYIKDGSKDCIKLTQKGKEWNSEINPSQLGNKSENQSKLGNKSEKTRKNIRKSSEINPTYKTTNNQTTNDQKKVDSQYRIDELSNSNKNKSSSGDDRSPYSEKFEQWWDLYPRKTGKGAAWKKWKGEKLEKRFEELVEKLKQQIAMDHTFANKTYIVGASRYLNEARYDDPVEQIKGGSNGITTNTGGNVPRGIEAQEQFARAAMEAYERSRHGNDDPL